MNVIDVYFENMCEPIKGGPFSMWPLVCRIDQKFKESSLAYGCDGRKWEEVKG